MRLGLTILFVVRALVLVTGTEAQAQRVRAVVDSTESVVKYTGSAPLHEWTGRSRSVEGTFVLDPRGPERSRARLQIPVASFDSGNDRRDRTMREVTDAEEHPFVTFQATVLHPTVWGRGSEGPAGRWAVTGELTFHGETRVMDDTVDVRVSGDTVRVRARFPISLTHFQVERPSIVGFSIADTIQIDAQLVGVAKGPSQPRKTKRSPDARTRSGRPGESGRSRRPRSFADPEGRTPVRRRSGQDTREDPPRP